MEQTHSCTHNTSGCSRNHPPHPPPDLQVAAREAGNVPHGQAGSTQPGVGRVWIAVALWDEVLQPGSAAHLPELQWSGAVPVAGMGSDPACCAASRPWCVSRSQGGALGLTFHCQICCSTQGSTAATACLSKVLFWVCSLLGGSFLASEHCGWQLSSARTESCCSLPKERELLRGIFQHPLRRREQTSLGSPREPKRAWKYIQRNDPEKILNENKGASEAGTAELGQQCWWASWAAAKAM